MTELGKNENKLLTRVVSVLRLSLSFALDGNVSLVDWGLEDGVPVCKGIDAF